MGRATGAIKKPTWGSSPCRSPFWSPPVQSSWALAFAKSTALWMQYEVSALETPASHWIQGGLGQPFPPQSPSSKRGTGLESWESILQSCYPVFCLSGPFFLWPLRMYRILWKSRWRSLALRQEPTTKARECWCQFSLCVRICTLFLPNESTTNQPCTKNPTDKSFWYLE